MKLIRHRNNILFFAALLPLLIIQFLFLNTVPPGMKHDEVEYALSSKTYALFGEDISGTPFPLSLVKTETLGRISAVPPLLFSPLWLILPMNQETVRLMYVILAVGIGVLTGYLSYVLFKNKIIAAITFLFFLMNPWEYFLSRFAADPSFALFFYLLGIILLLRLNGPLLIFAFLAFVLGFFSYNAAKILLIPLVLLCLVYRFSKKTNVQRKRPYTEIIFLIGVLVFFISTFLASKFIPGTIVSNRLEEIVFFNSDLLSSAVNSFRSQVIISPFSGLFINKLTESVRLFFEHYFVAFSPVNLFVVGDPNSLLGYYYHGLFYIIDALFITFALYILAQKQKRLFFFIVGLLLIAPLALGASTVGVAVVTRSFLLLPILVILSAYGCVMLHRSISNSTFRKLFVFSAVLIVSFSYINFLYYYFMRQPVTAQENFLTSERVLAKYLSNSAQAGIQTIVIHPEPRQLYLQAVFYNSPEKQTALLRNNKAAFLQNKYKLETVSFTSTCPKNIDSQNIYIVGAGVKDCLQKQKVSYYLIRKQDAGHVFKVFNGKICKNVQLSSWKANHTLSDFAIEDMDNKTLCETWFARYN